MSNWRISTALYSVGSNLISVGGDAVDKVALANRFVGSTGYWIWHSRIRKRNREEILKR